MTWKLERDSLGNQVADEKGVGKKEKKIMLKVFYIPAWKCPYVIPFNKNK